MSIEGRWIEAFNARDMNSMVDLLCEDATAEVLGSDYGVEEGREKISRTSFPYLLNEVEGPLIAEAAVLDDDVLILMTRKDNGHLDMLLRMQEKDGKIARIDYLVTAYRLSDVKRVADALGMKVTR